jgi:serine kinase of HPr protein (carbohydrate metabolism regulator)
MGTLHHATTVSLAGQGIFITGPSGAGKSDLALRLIDAGAILVADDQTELQVSNGRLLARAPRTILGKIEIRGMGILTLPTIENIPLALAVAPGEGERIPEPDWLELMGVALPRVRLSYMDASTVAKIRLWLAHEHHP